MKRVKKQVGEIIFNKSLKNLKKVFNRLNSTNLNRYVKAEREEVLFLAMGGYNRTFEMLERMGLQNKDISTMPSLNLSRSFIEETHGKKVVHIKKINYTTNTWKNDTYTKKILDLNVANSFEESMMIYAVANRDIYINKQKERWDKPSVVVLDDPSCNLQFEGYRFNFQNKIGYVQARNRNADPQMILKEIENVEEAESMMFAMYQDTSVDEVDVLNALSRLRENLYRKIEEEWYIKPTEFKKITGSTALFNKMKEMKELGIRQLKSNKKIGKENARWLVIPEMAFEFTGYQYMDEEELFENEISQEEAAEETFEVAQQKRLDEILAIELPLNVKQGFVGKSMGNSKNETLKNFLAEIDEVEAQKAEGIGLLSDATTDSEYKHIKKNSLIYFLDGEYKNNERLDENYLGGKRLVSIDIDEADYTRDELEEKLQMQGFFGLIYRTAKYYFDGSNRWRVVMMADESMTKSDYAKTVEGVANMLGLEIDNASKKITQLMGYPLASKDLSTVVGSMINVQQFRRESELPTSKKRVVAYDFSKSKKSLMDFDHEQARLLKRVITGGIAEGSRNETYFQIYLYLNDTLNNPEMKNWHEEAAELLEVTKQQALADGLSEKEVGMIYREN